MLKTVKRVSAVITMIILTVIGWMAANIYLIEPYFEGRTVADFTKDPANVLPVLKKLTQATHINIPVPLISFPWWILLHLMQMAMEPMNF